MRITSSVTAAPTLHAETSTEAATAENGSVANTPDHASTGANPFAALGEPVSRALLNSRPATSVTAPAASGPSASNPRHALERHGIIVIGGAQAHEAASTVRDAVKQGPLLQGIIIVGGSVAVPVLPKGR